VPLASSSPKLEQRTVQSSKLGELGMSDLLVVKRSRREIFQADVRFAAPMVTHARHKMLYLQD
jgi:hypothetical protein